jgi:hypothetical protein
MVREVRFLWSDPSFSPRESACDSADDWDDLDLTPLRRRPARVRKTLRPSRPERKTASVDPGWPTVSEDRDGG